MRLEKGEAAERRRAGTTGKAGVAALAGGAQGVVALCGWLPQSESWQEGATGMKGLPKQLAKTLFTFRYYDICRRKGIMA